MKIVNYLTLIGMALVLSNCSSFNFEDEKDIEHALKGFNDKEKFTALKLSPSTKGIHSLDLDIQNETEKEMTINSLKMSEKMKKTSSKNLYFTLLYNEYLILKSYGDKEIPDINSCPHFHSNVVKTKSSYLKNEANNLNNLKTSYTLKGADLSKVSEELGVHPELSLPLNFKEGKSETVMDVIQRKNQDNLKTLVYNAYRIYLEKNFLELSEMCENGVSSNYFIFENMLTHFQKNAYAEDDKIKAIPILLKSLIFSNLAIIESFENKLGKTKVKEEFLLSEEIKGTYQEVLERFSANWLKSYLFQIKSASR